MKKYIPLISDAPTLIDNLDRAELVQQVARHAAKCAPPQVFGVHGDWGAGKSSFLHQLRYYLTGEKFPGSETVIDSIEQGKYKNQIVSVWFEAWRYQHEAVPVVALIQEMRKQLSTAQYFKASIKKLGEVTARALLNSVDDAAKLIGIEALPFSADKIQTIGEKWEKEHLSQRLSTDSIQDHLTKTISEILTAITPERARGARMVIMIDDLDRCGADAAYRLLEGLKIYLNLPNCVFILGMNQQAVVDAIAKSLPSLDDKGEPAMRVRAEAYLEKLCSNIWRLPLPSDPGALMIRWVSEDDLRAHLANALNGNNGTALRCLPPNPRRLKALANLLQRCNNSDRPVTNTREAKLLLMTAYIYQFHPDLFHRWQYDPDFFNQIIDWLKGGKASDMPYFKYLTLPVQALAPNTSEAEPRTLWGSAFPDPGACEVFWIAPLLVDMVDDVTPNDFKSYLLGIG